MRNLYPHTALGARLTVALLAFALWLSPVAIAQDNNDEEPCIITFILPDGRSQTEPLACVPSMPGLPKTLPYTIYDIQITLTFYEPWPCLIPDCGICFELQIVDGKVEYIDKEDLNQVWCEGVPTPTHTHTHSGPTDTPTHTPTPSQTPTHTPTFTPTETMTEVPPISPSPLPPSPTPEPVLIEIVVSQPRPPVLVVNKGQLDDPNMEIYSTLEARAMTQLGLAQGGTWLIEDQLAADSTGGASLVVAGNASDNPIRVEVHPNRDWESLRSGRVVVRFTYVAADGAQLSQVRAVEIRKVIGAARETNLAPPRKRTLRWMYRG